VNITVVLYTFNPIKLKEESPVNGKVIIVTGAASGIGAETAELLAHSGASLVLADINIEGLNTTVQKIRTFNRNTIGVPIDVRQSDSWESVLEKAVTTFGTVDILVNCAGVAYPDPIDILTEELLRRQVDVNLLGAMIGTQVVLRYFLKEEKGHIIHVASLASLAPLPDETVYTATKFGLRGFCLALDLELRRSPVRISLVSPDAVDTPMLRYEAMHRGSTLVFSGSILQPKRVAKAVLKTIHRPKLEVLVPGYRGMLSRLACIFPWLLSLLYPVMDRIGRRNLDKYIAHIKTENDAQRRGVEIVNEQSVIGNTQEEKGIVVT
jgi:short-subunit dehydrogenase